MITQNKNSKASQTLLHDNFSTIINLFVPFLALDGLYRLVSKIVVAPVKIGFSYIIKAMTQHMLPSETLYLFGEFLLNNAVRIMALVLSYLY